MRDVFWAGDHRDAAAAGQTLGFPWIEPLEGRRLLHAGHAHDGLLAEYFDNPDLTVPRVTRVDPTINFDWGGGSPDGSMGPDEFSVRWSGTLVSPLTDTFTFHATTDDGIRLWVDNKLIIDQFVPAAGERTAAIALSQGREYDIRLEYLEAGGGAVAQLRWSTPRVPKEVIPPGWMKPTPQGAPPVPNPAPTPPAVTQPPPSLPAVRINVGGPRYVDSGGQVWEADQHFTGGRTPKGSFTVNGTAEGPLFADRRQGTFRYAVPVASGAYNLRLVFAEPQHAVAGKRTFDVTAENRLIFDDLDIAAHAGRQTALVTGTPVDVSDGRLDLYFESRVDNAILSAIELVPREGGAAPAPQPPAPVPEVRASWREVAAAPQVLFESESIAANGRLYVFGGFHNSAVQATRRAYSYDPAANKWARIADLPTALTHAGVAADGDTIYLAGGLVGNYPDNPPTADVWRYHIPSNTWSRGPSLPAPRGAGALVKSGRSLHFFGGLRADAETDSADHWVLNLDAPTTWNAAAPLPAARNHLGGVELGGKVYAVGGQRGRDETTQNMSDVHRYDPATNRWEAVASLPRPRSHFGASAFVNPRTGRLTIVGGVTNGRVPLAEVTEYDPATNRWTEQTPLPRGLKAPVARVVGNAVIVSGGSTGDASPQRTTWVWTL